MATRAVVLGMPSAECLTCGQREVAEDPEHAFDIRPGPDPRLARAVTAYAARCRDELDQSETQVISHAGLWLLLASVAEHVTGDEGESLGQILGMPPAEADAAARRLLAEPHPTLATAVGAWAAGGVDTPLEAERPIPDQVTLDAWADRQTRGLIERFPAEVTSEILVLLASALVLEPGWTETLGEDDGELVLRGGLQTIVSTEAAGLVAVAKPFSEDGIDVISVTAAPEIPPSQVWRAVEEVAALLGDGALWREEMPAEASADGHSWRSWTEHTTVLSSEAGDLPAGPNGRPQRWRSRLRPWSATATVDLESAPGVAEVSRALLPEYRDPEVGCLQSVRAEYDQDGFRAAVVTAAFMATGAPQFVEVEMDHVELDLTGPHAVVAIARGGAWEGVPLVSAWVTPEMWTAAPSSSMRGRIASG